METTPNLGLVIPSADSDPFDQLVLRDAFRRLDTLLGRLLTHSTTAAEVVNSTAEAELFSYQVAAGEFEAGRVGRFLFVGDWLDNSNNAAAWTLRLKLDGATVLEYATGSLQTVFGFSASRGGWRIEGSLHMLAAASEFLHGLLTVSGQGGGATGIERGDVAEAAVDFAAAVTLSLTAQCNVAATTDAWRLRGGALWLD